MGSAIAVAIVLLLAYLFGGYVAAVLVGGVLGERWHSKLTRRAVSGKYGPDRADRQPPGRPTDQP